MRWRKAGWNDVGINAAVIARSAWAAPRLLLLLVDCEAVDQQLHGELMQAHCDGFES
jgi:hypothetical protein